MPKHKTLFLVRHAKSSWDDPTLDDINRPLNKRGKIDAPEMGRRMAAYKVKPGHVVSSPALRARKTAEAIAEELGFKKSDIDINQLMYTWESDALLDIVKVLDDAHGSVMMVCHNPAVTELVNELTGEEIANVPTCGVAVIRFNAGKWSEIKKEKGELLSFDYPKKV